MRVARHAGNAPKSNATNEREPAGEQPERRARSRAAARSAGRPDSRAGAIGRGRQAPGRGRSRRRSTASSTLSVRSWRTMRPRPAPSASRTASSRPACRITRKKQAGDVRAGDEQHAGHDRQQQIERLRVVAPQRVECPGRRDSRPRADVRAGFGARSSARQRLMQQRLGLRPARAHRRRPARTRPITRNAQYFGLLSTSRPRSITGIIGTTGREHVDRPPRLEAEEARRRDADDDRRRAVDGDRLTDDPRIAPKQPLPADVGENGHRWRARPIVLRRDRPAERHADAERAGEVAADDERRRRARRGRPTPPSEL